MKILAKQVIRHYEAGHDLCFPIILSAFGTAADEITAAAQALELLFVIGQLLELALHMLGEVGQDGFLATFCGNDKLGLVLGQIEQVALQLGVFEKFKRRLFVKAFECVVQDVPPVDRHGQQDGYAGFCAPARCKLDIFFDPAKLGFRGVIQFDIRLWQIKLKIHEIAFDAKMRG